MTAAGAPPVTQITIQRVDGPTACGTAIVRWPDASSRILWTLEARGNGEIHLRVHPVNPAEYGPVASRLEASLSSWVDPILAVVHERHPSVLEVTR